MDSAFFYRTKGIKYPSELLSFSYQVTKSLDPGNSPIDEVGASNEKGRENKFGL